MGHSFLEIVNLHHAELIGLNCGVQGSCSFAHRLASLF